MQSTNMINNQLYPYDQNNIELEKKFKDDLFKAIYLYERIWLSIKKD